MRLVLKLIALVAYVVYAMYLQMQASRYLIDQNRTHWTSPLLDPSLYTPEGLPYRRRALRFGTWGLVPLAIILFLF